MNQPKFIKDFSRVQSSDERLQLAKEIKEKRNSHFEANKTIRSKEQIKGELEKNIETLQSKIELHKSASFFAKIKDFLAIKKVQAELLASQNEHATLEEQLSASIDERPDLEDTRQMINSFYSSEKKKWADSQYSEEDIEKNFSEEHLASLNLNDYVTLLQRFPGHMVTHVTRQGVRNQTMVYHSKGDGEQRNGFKSMIETKRLQSPLAVAMSEAKNYHDICEFLNGGEEVITYRDCIDEQNIQPTNPARVLNGFKSFTSGNINEDYHDKAAIHFGIEKVLNAMYGGEQGNDIFIAYPIAHIASQYNYFNKYNGQNLKHDDGDDFRNDLYVWGDNEARGMDIDAGVVFIPENAQVDVVTGSQYEIDDAGKPTAELGLGGSKGFKRVDKVITSREYWEEYFAANPSKKPNKIVYYDARLTPTEVLHDWKQKNGIKNKKDIADIGFKHNNVGFDFKRADGDAKVQNFRNLALTALREEYPIDVLLINYDNKFFTKTPEEQQLVINEMYGK